MRRRVRGVEVGGSTDGFTLVEILSVVVILGILGALAVMTTSSVSKTRLVNEAIGDVLDMQEKIDAYILANDELPATLSAVGITDTTDPWGRAYVYLPFDEPSDLTDARRDKLLNPLNTYYDLYSKGEDGLTAKPVTAEEAYDDIVRANDGGFVGLARNY